MYTEAIIKDKGDKKSLIVDGKIIIWDFHSGVLLSKIIIYNHPLYGKFLWNNDYLMAGYKN